MFSTPGPSVIPDRVLQAMHRGAPNIHEGELVALTDTVIADLKRMAGTDGHVAIFIGNGHSVWEASIANLLAPGDRVLVLASGPFGHGWAATAERLGADVELIDFGFREPADPARVEQRLREDSKHSIRAVLTVQTDTGSSVRNDVVALRRAIDAAAHPGLLGVDSIASFGCEPMRMDEWGVDLVLAASQKGLMVPPGVAFTFHGARAEERRVSCPSPYWDWEPRIRPRWFYQLFCGTPPTHHLYGLRQALDMINEEGLDNVLKRHETFARAVWAAVEMWGKEGELRLNVESPGQRSHAVTTVRTGPGDANRLRDWCSANGGLTLGVGLTTPGENGASLFRIGHMGHLNPHMVLGTLATIEAGLDALDISRGQGAIEAAAAEIAAAV